ncbi:Putative ABC transporter substrate-binding lipoprotein YhfQ [Bacillus rhizoplanae]|uniref:ABC transporter substrate-binding lipoprotein YhfQ n=1 Tax=Bacillus rhizoplanae TaxID=2880966 RepID=A0ABM8Y873_9BACI|nr:iron-siderophore ABC transporter substrate-binding protein [Bacillus rhizoplanae]CAG9611900.1 Putative ABC transporter substrate-binding lipoprotein YhfQ [Bacillus rhizoplanae]
MKGKKLSTLLVAMSLMVGALAGCSGGAKETAKKEDKAEATKQASSVKVKHEWGETELKETPKNIVTLDFSFIDTLTALGVTPVGNAGVGTTKIPEYLQDKVSKVTDVGERKAPNLEVVSSVNPDLIIASKDRHNMIQKELQDIAPTIAFDDNSYEEVMKNMDTIAKAVGKEEEAKKVKTDLDNKISKAKEKVKGNPTVLVIGAFDDEFSVWIKDSFIGTLMTDIGVTYAYEGEKAKTEGKAEIAKITMERLNEINPDYIFLYGENVEKFKNNPLYNNLKAVKEKHVVDVDRNLWARGRGPIAADKILDEAIPALTGQSSK